MDFSHFNESGRARMVNVSDKKETHRTAIAAGRVLVNRETLELIRTGGMKKGDVLGTAQIGGIMGAKNAPHIIPMCHPIIRRGHRLPAQRRGLRRGNYGYHHLHRRHRRGDGGVDRCIRGGADGV